MLSRFFVLQSVLESNNFFSLQAFLALHNFEFYALAFFKILEAIAPDGAIVDKYVVCALTADKTKAF